MDFLQRIGGRKFLMAMISIGVAVFLDVKTDKGLTTTMATFLGTMVAAFHMANHASTRTFLQSKGQGRNPDDKIDKLVEAVTQASNPEAMANLSNLLNSINAGIHEVKGTTGQLGTAVISIGKEVQVLKKSLNTL